MTKKKKPKPSATEDAAPETRSKPRLALFGLAALALIGGGGFAAWSFRLAPAEAVAAAEAPGESDGEATGHDTEADNSPGAGLPREVLAESSFTHVHALSVLMAPVCGAMAAPALDAASEAEAEADGRLVSLSWTAAARRAAGFTDRSCGMVEAEVYNADAKAALLAEAKAKGETGAAKAGH